MMEYNRDKVDEMTLALLFLTLHEQAEGKFRAWKEVDWDVSNRLYEMGWIENPRNKNRSFALTKAGVEACERLFRQHFSSPAHDE